MEFLNVDLEIESHKKLQPIVTAFGDDVHILYCGEAHKHQLATFEASGICTDEADSLINFFCVLVEGLDDEAVSIWNSAFRKEFNIGYQSGLEPSHFESNIRNSTLKRIADLGASIKITIYPPRPFDDEKPEA